MKLDNLKNIKDLDKNKVFESMELLPDQIQHVLQDAKNIKIPKNHKKINQVVINGMGGSNLGPGIIKAVFSDQIKVPISIYPGYQVPASVDKNTLFILSSYSGTTEETLSVYNEVKKRKAKIAAITSGGKLEKIIKKNNLPHYIFEDKYNPSNVPRIGLGYSIFGIAMLLSKFGLFKLSTQTIKKIIADLTTWNKKLNLEVKTKNNIAKKIALKTYNKQIVLVGAEFLTGNIRTLRNQFCETGKNFASYLLLPDMNHFAMEGLAYPKANAKNLLFIFFDSKLYHPKIQTRSQLTKQVIRKNKINTLQIQLKSQTKAEQSFEMLQLGTWITYYLGILNNANPATNPWVDWFKKQL